MYIYIVFVQVRTAKVTHDTKSRWETCSTCTCTPVLGRFPSPQLYFHTFTVQLRTGEEVVTSYILNHCLLKQTYETWKWCKASQSNSYQQQLFIHYMQVFATRLLPTKDSFYCTTFPCKTKKLLTKTKFTHCMALSNIKSKWPWTTVLLNSPYLKF